MLWEKCQYWEFYWSIFSGIQTKYREILHISQYSIQMTENMDQKNPEYGHFSRIVLNYFFILALNFENLNIWLWGLLY